MNFVFRYDIYRNNYYTESAKNTHSTCVSYFHIHLVIKFVVISYKIQFYTLIFEYAAKIAI